MGLNKIDYDRAVKLYMKQDWLIEKEKELKKLLKLCKDKQNKDLAFSLLERFYYVDQKKYQYLLDQITDYIINKTGFIEGTTQLLAMAFDDGADSSQKILDTIKTKFVKNGWKNIKTVNIFKKCTKNIQEGKTQIICIDEFLGSGKTLRARNSFFKTDSGLKNINTKFEVIYCYLAGIKDSIETLKNEGIRIFCPLQLEKGISGFYKGEDLKLAKLAMIDLESKLSPQINEKKLDDFSFGYGGAEALYSLDENLGNTPNSVFPIFWWPKDINNKDRETVLSRYETGF